MSYTLGQLFRDTLPLFDRSFTGTATGGSTTTVVDTTLSSSTFKEDGIKGGTIVIVYDADGAAALPETQITKITAYNPSTKTFTVSAITAVGAGDVYCVFPPDIPYEKLLEVANAAIRRFKAGYTDESLTTATNQTEYDLPVAIMPTAVFVQTKLDDANDNRWTPILQWSVQFSSNGTAQLVIPQYTAGYTIRLDYMGSHPRLYAYSDVIAAAIPEELVKASFVERIWSALVDSDYEDGEIQAGYNKAAFEYGETKLENPIQLPRKQRPSIRV